MILVAATMTLATTTPGINSFLAGVDVSGRRSTFSWEVDFSGRTPTF